MWAGGPLAAGGGFWRPGGGMSGVTPGRGGGGGSGYWGVGGGGNGARKERPPGCGRDDLLPADSATSTCATDQKKVSPPVSVRVVEPGATGPGPTPSW